MGKKGKRMAIIIGGVMLVLVTLLLWLVAMPSPAQQASVNGSNPSSAKNASRTHNAKKSSEGEAAASSSPAATHGDRGLDDHLEVDEGGLLQKAVFDYMSQHGHSDWKLSDIAITQEIKKYWGGYAGAHSEQYPAGGYRLKDGTVTKNGYYGGGDIPSANGDREEFGTRMTYIHGKFRLDQLQIGSDDLVNNIADND